MLAAAPLTIAKGVISLGTITWFATENAVFAARVFGSMVQTIEILSAVSALVFALRAHYSAHGKRIRVVPYNPIAQTSSFGIAFAARGSIYVVAEELNKTSIETPCDELYRGVGCDTAPGNFAGLLVAQTRTNRSGRRSAYLSRSTRPNFSYLENRCDPAAATQLFHNRKFQERGCGFGFLTGGLAPPMGFPNWMRLPVIAE